MLGVEVDEWLIARAHTQIHMNTHMHRHTDTHIDTHTDTGTDTGTDKQTHRHTRTHTSLRTAHITGSLMFVFVLADVLKKATMCSSCTRRCRSASVTGDSRSACR